MTLKHGRLGAAGAIALLAVAAAALAGCSAAGSGQGSPAVASLPGHPGTASAAGQTMTQNQADQDFVDFTRCMRAHGVAMSDPFHRPGHAGLSIDLPPRDSATRPAYTACNHFIQRIVQMKEAHATAISAADLPALTRYAECMRAHDISMLDPASDGSLSLGNVPGMNSDFGRYSPQFREADTACRHLLPAGVSDNGTGP